MTSTKRYPRDLQNGDRVIVPTRDGSTILTVAWVEPTSQHVRTIEGTTPTQWMRLGVSPNAKVQVAR